jgi:excisionase family DNA binding protein
MDNQTDRLLFRVGEAADVLGVARATVYKLLADGSLPSVRVGKSLRVPVVALKQWIDARARTVDRG